MAKNILIGYQKGGVGKTTIAINVAYYLKSLDVNNETQVMLIDKDEHQHSCTSWSLIRKSIDKAIPIETISYSNFKRLSPEVQQSFNYNVFDVTGEFNILLDLIDRENIDSIIVPLTPDLVDYLPLEVFLKNIKKKDTPNAKLKVFFLFNKVSDHRSFIEAQEKVLQQIQTTNCKFIKLKLLRSTITNLKSFPAEFAAGRSSLEHSYIKRTHQDIARIFKELTNEGAF